MLAASLAGGCQHNSIDEKKRVKEKLKKLAPLERTFLVPVETAWRAAQRSLKYQIAIDNMEHGILETDWVRGEDAFVPAHLNGQPSSGTRYKITMKIMKGKRGTQNVTRVTVSKQIERQRDFFDEGEELDSDMWEEKVLLYRIDREIAIEEGLRKSSKR